MQKMLAITEIHRCVEPGKPADRLRHLDSVPPKIEVIKSGHTFFPQDVEEKNDLIRLKAAIVAPEEASKEHVSAVAPKAEKAVKAAAGAVKKAVGAGKAAGKATEDGGSTTMNAPVDGGMSNSGVTTHGGDGNDLV